MACKRDHGNWIGDEESRSSRIQNNKLRPEYLTDQKKKLDLQEELKALSQRITNIGKDT